MPSCSPMAMRAPVEVHPILPRTRTNMFPFSATTVAPPTVSPSPLDGLASHRAPGARRAATAAATEFSRLPRRATMVTPPTATAAPRCARSRTATAAPASPARSANRVATRSARAPRAATMETRILETGATPGALSRTGGRVTPRLTGPGRTCATAAGVETGCPSARKSAMTATPPTGTDATRRVGSRQGGRARQPTPRSASPAATARSRAPRHAMMETPRGTSPGECLFLFFRLLFKFGVFTIFLCSQSNSNALPPTKPNVYLVATGVRVAAARLSLVGRAPSPLGVLPHRVPESPPSATLTP
jgi:hypothetical protein